MVNSGMNAATMMAVEKNTALSICSALIRIRRSRSVQTVAPDESTVALGSAPHRPSASCASSTSRSSGRAWKLR
jgi:hypothetical protein